MPRGRYTEGAAMVRRNRETSRMNKITLFGRIGRDPETRQAGNTEVCEASLATTEVWKDKSGERKERTAWHRIEAWGPTAKALARVNKGDRLLIEGSLEYQEWTDKDGNKRTTAKIRIGELTYIEKADGGGERQSDRGERGGRQQTERKGNDRAPAPPMTGDGGGFDDDDIPF